MVVNFTSLPFGCTNQDQIELVGHTTRVHAYAVSSLHKYLLIDYVHRRQQPKPGRRRKKYAVCPAVRNTAAAVAPQQ